ncbi:MAG: hypothetical protein WD278_01930 [Pirellulales bacterium]
MVSAGPLGPPDVTPPDRRLVLLGASNLTRGISTVVETASLTWGRPLDVLAAMGHGRSYGQRSTVLGRGLPGIVECGLWRALADRPRGPAAALLTDVGNDLFYEVPVERIASWVETCLERLARIEARIVMTRMPVANLETVAPWQFRLMRALFFPMCRLAFDEVARRALALDERLCRLAREHGCCLVEHRAEWYGLDPIHIKLGHSPAAWCELLGSWAQQALPAPASSSFSRWFYLRLLAPELRWWFGIPRRSAQPSGLLPDGTTISLY